MKCYLHPKDDAIAICKICGKGVCSNCLITISGDSYCKTCVEAGRVKVPTLEVPPPPPPVEVPMPAGVPSKTPFYVGGAGSILSAVAALLFTTFSWLSLFTLSVHYGEVAYLSGLVFASTIGGTILAVGLILAGVGYLGIKRNYGASSGTAGFALSIVVCVSLFVSMVLAIIALVYTPSYYYYYNNPWYVIYALSLIITFLLFGVMQVLWGAAHINTRRYTGHSGLALATGIMLIISGALTMTVLLATLGGTLFLVSEIMATVVFLTSRIPQQGIQAS